jgi:hypothetical protein
MFNAASKNNQFTPIKSVNTAKSILILVSKVKHKVLPKIINFYRPYSFLFEVAPGIERQRMMTFFKTECVIVILQEESVDEMVSEVRLIMAEQPEACIYLLHNHDEKALAIRKCIPEAKAPLMNYVKSNHSAADLIDFVFQLP